MKFMRLLLPIVLAMLLFSVVFYDARAAARMQALPDSWELVVFGDNYTGGLTINRPNEFRLDGHFYAGDTTDLIVEIDSVGLGTEWNPGEGVALSFQVVESSQSETGGDWWYADNSINLGQFEPGTYLIYTSVMTGYASLFDYAYQIGGDHIRADDGTAGWFKFQHFTYNPPDRDITLHITNVKTYGVGDEPSPDLPMPFDSFCHITITDTVTLTDTQGITSTEVITVDYTAESNLAPNFSFEDGASRPDGWIPVVGGIESEVPPFYSTNDSSAARNGVDAIYNGGAFELWGDLPLLEPGNYLVGFYARCDPADCETDDIIARWDSSDIIAVESLTETYQVFSTTRETGGGSPWFVIDFPSANGTAYIDDAFVYPIDGETGDLFCDPLYYPPPETDEEPTPPGPGIVPDQSTACWACATPDNWYSIGLWLRWLGCKIHNLFYCALYIWLLNIANWLSGLWGRIVAFFAWIPASFQQLINWAVGVINSWLGWLADWWDVIRTQISEIYRGLVQSVMNSEIVQVIWGWFSWVSAAWDVVKLILSALIEIIHRVYTALINLVEFLVETFLALRDALSADLWEIYVVTESGEEVTTILPGDLYADGPNTTKILWLFLASLGSVDYVVGMFSQFQILLVAVVGAMAIGVFMWTARIWHDILPT